MKNDEKSEKHGSFIKEENKEKWEQFLQNMPDSNYPYWIAVNSSLELMICLGEGKHFDEVYGIMMKNVNPAFIRHMVLKILCAYSVRGREFMEYCEKIQNT